VRSALAGYPDLAVKAVHNRGVKGPARALWAKTTLHVWSESYRLVSLPRMALAEAAALVAGAGDGFCALVLERDEVSLTVAEEVWATSPLRPSARQDAGPFKVITFNLDLDLAVTGYLAPAAEALAHAGVPIVPQCAFLKDHLLVPAEQLPVALTTLAALVTSARSNPKD
jgi:hypothetical protein